MSSENRTLVFSQEGILGFEDLTEFTLSVYDENTPFYCLESTVNPDISFIVIEPAFLVSDYAFDLPSEVADELGIHAEEDAFVLVILTVPEDPKKMTANLLGPLVFHQGSGRGKQLILEKSHYPVQFPLFQEEAEEGR